MPLHSHNLLASLSLQDFSLGVTGLLDDLMKKYDAEAELDKGEEEVVDQVFQHTADLCGEVQAVLGALGNDEGANRWEALKEELGGDRESCNFKETFNSTGSLTAALAANEARLEVLRSELQELKKLNAAKNADAQKLDQLLQDCGVNKESVLPKTPEGWRRVGGA